jgi:hypothetical protein
MENLTICETCHNPDVCVERNECGIEKHINEDVATLRSEEEAFMEWINDHATNRDRNGGAA